MGNDYRNKYLELAPEVLRQSCLNAVAVGGGWCAWAALQQAFLAVTDEYLERELMKPAEDNIENHEAGGQWRIAFPQLRVRGENPAVQSRLAETMAARRSFALENYHHGFPDCAEVHHEIETFLYFQLPLLYSAWPGSEDARESIEDVAHHAGNWINDVPSWYDWDRHRFVSMWLGTREVRDYPPYDYQEANHFRFIDVVLAAYVGTKKQRYLDLAVDYAQLWCDHIEACAEAGEPIRCSILPPGIDASEMGRSGKRRDKDLERYVIFYGTVSTNTAYDIVMALQDVYRVTGEKRFLKTGELLTDQFFEHGTGGRPASQFAGGRWKQHEAPLEPERYSFLGDAQGTTFLSHMALRHDMISGEDRYGRLILDWAGEIDEVHVQSDQMAPDLLVAAHYYDGNPQWLERAYAMALRTAAVLEPLDNYNQSGGANRQASRYLMQHLYQPLLGGCDWGIRGNMPVTGLRHAGKGVSGLPADVGFRCWRDGSSAGFFEAVNLSSEVVEWEVSGDTPAPPETVRLDPNGSVSGVLPPLVIERY